MGKHLTPNEKKDLFKEYTAKLSYYSNGLADKSVTLEDVQSLIGGKWGVTSRTVRNIIAELEPKETFIHRVEVPAEVIEKANAVRISQGDKIIGTFPLTQNNQNHTQFANQKPLDAVATTGAKYDFIPNQIKDFQFSIHPCCRFFAVADNRKFINGHHPNCPTLKPFELDDDLLALSDEKPSEGKGTQTIGCLQCSYLGDKVYKYCDECFNKIEDFPDVIGGDVRIPETSSDYEISGFEKPNLPKEKRVKLTKSEVELFATDVHFPFEEKTGWELFLQVARDTQPDILWLNGDILDGFAVAQWDKDPNTAHENNIQFEFDYCRNKLEELREILPNARFYFKEGNHETRLQRFLNKKAPELRCLKSITIPFNLELERLEMEWIDNNDKFKLGNLWHIHGNEIRGGGVNVALAKLRKIMANVIFGHYHIEQSALMRQYDGSPIGAWAIASLCDFQQDYVHFAETWSNGFARIEYLASGLFHVQPTQILQDGNKKICRVDGVWYEKEIVN